MTDFCTVCSKELSQCECCKKCRLPLHVCGCYESGSIPSNYNGNTKKKRKRITKSSISLAYVYTRDKGEKPTNDGGNV